MHSCIDRNLLELLSVMIVPTNLTNREREIIPFLLTGTTRAEIASHFGVSEETIKVHVRNIIKKFDATSVRDCFKWLNLYNQYYGVEGAGTQLHVLDSELDYYLADDRKSLRLLRKFGYLVVAEPVTIVKRVYSDVDRQPTVEFLADFPVTTTYVRENDRHIYTAEFEQPFQKGARFELSEKLALADHHDIGSGYDRINFTTPFERRHLRYHFPIHDVPQSIECVTRLGGAICKVKNVASELQDNVFHVRTTYFEKPFTIEVTWKYEIDT